jgi:hypothetical protein
LNSSGCNRSTLGCKPKNSSSQVKPGVATGPCACGFGVQARATKNVQYAWRLFARALHPKARSHDPITAPERLRSIHGFKFPLQANRQAHQNSRAMRVAEVKEEAAGRGTRSKAHRPAVSSATVASAWTCYLSHHTLNRTFEAMRCRLGIFPEAGRQPLDSLVGHDSGHVNSSF